VAKLRWTAEAVRWLQEIHDYIARENPDAAHRTVTGIRERAQVLLTFPDIAPRYQGDQRVRLLVEGRYRIAYIVGADGTIDILGVFHHALPLDRYLR
jgi:toxin ParE1/3/4